MINVTLNGQPLSPDAKVTVKRGISQTSAAWVNGRRLNPGETIEMDGVVVHLEPGPSLRDSFLKEEGNDGAFGLPGTPVAPES